MHTCIEQVLLLRVE